MIAPRNLLYVAAVLAIICGLVGTTYLLAQERPMERPTLGNRGVQRARALRGNALFALIEPVIRYVAVWIAEVPATSIRAALRPSLLHSGDYLGLSEDELLAASAIMSASLGAAATGACHALGVPLYLGAAGWVLGGMAPWLRIQAVARHRAKDVDRALPGSVELAAMCMGAGLDFPGALRRIVETATDPRAPLIEEFTRILQELELGHTRRSAMESFQRRVPTDQVRELVTSVVQAEDKGSPLAPVLSIQAQTQRLRRSIAAEEAASDAALMLMGPMALIFLCVIVLLLGPVVVRFIAGGLGPW